jgi:long-chain acyl-CoA synthetase
VRLLQHYVSEQAQRRPDASAIAWKGERLSYGALERRTNRIARLIAELGAERGDRVALLLPK